MNAKETNQLPDIKPNNIQCIKVQLDLSLSPNKVLEPLRITSSLNPLSLPPLSQGIATSSTGKVSTQMGSVIHLGEPGQGEDAQEAGRCHHAEHFGSDQASKEDPALGPESFSELVRQYPQCDLVTSENR